MDSNCYDSNEPSVDEGAFWHTNMDLYYGYISGEIVEVEHEPNKYWLASIQYCFKHLVLMKWIGGYGEQFWVDTSATNTTSLNGTLNEFSNPKRLYPLGYHLQSQFKSQFSLEKPSKILVKPSLYDPSKDPYANIETVDDLLDQEISEHSNEDAFAVKPTSDTASLALAKCKTKISYGQEDQEELEAALQSLTGPEQFDESTGRKEAQEHKKVKTNNAIASFELEAAQDNDLDQVSTKSQGVALTDGLDTDMEAEIKGESKTAWLAKIPKEITPKEEEQQQPAAVFNEQNCFDQQEWDRHYKEYCTNLQAQSIKKGRHVVTYSLRANHKEDVLLTRPKQFFDLGGTNHERLFVPGTLLEICHSQENDLGQLDLFQWFAFVIKNVGGRLTLRWFLCDEPKFKQGRLEFKSSRSRYISEESEHAIDGDDSCEADENKVTEDIEPSTTKAKSREDGLSSKSISFSMHFCNPKIHTISHAKNIDRTYKLPHDLSSHILAFNPSSDLDSIEKIQKDHIFDTRRINLDKDRPLIDHILTMVRINMPNYLDLIFAPKDGNNRRDVLLSCPKMTKLLRATVKRELGTGIYEIHSESASQSDEIVKIIYPYDSAYAVLPSNWANSNQDCLSVNASRNPSPSTAEHRVKKKLEMSNSEKSLEVTCLDSDKYSEIAMGKKDKTGLDQGFLIDNHSRKRLICAAGAVPVNCKLFISANSDFDVNDSTCCSQMLHNMELEITSFHCCLDASDVQAFDKKFKVMDLLEVVHPSSDSIICTGRIRKIVFPLIWIQLSSDCYTLLPYNSTDIYPNKWCETYNHKVISLLPPRKKCSQNNSTPQQNDTKRRKKAKISDDNEMISGQSNNSNELYEKEHFDLGSLNDSQLSIDYILSYKTSYIKIFFNSKCFTGPSLSKSKICSLPQYVGPGHMRLVLEEVVTKVISVAYVPPRILNDLSSQSFKELLVERNLTNTMCVEFKAKYQKRVHRDQIPVCIHPDDVALYCECICEHIKCCYNLFGLMLYDGDDCPSHCRSLTKSNKFMKRATYYREKARQGEFLNQGNGDSVNTKKNNPSMSLSAAAEVKTRPRYAGRGSSESTSSSGLSSSDQANRFSPSLVRPTISGSDKMEISKTIREEEEGVNQIESDNRFQSKNNDYLNASLIIDESKLDKKCSDDKAKEQDTTDQTPKEYDQKIEMDTDGWEYDLKLVKGAVCSKDAVENMEQYGSCSKEIYSSRLSTLAEHDLYDKALQNRHLQQSFDGRDQFDHTKNKRDSQPLDAITNFTNPDSWTIDDVARYLEDCSLGIFKTYMKSEGIDGQALLLLDKGTIEEHVQQQMKSDITQEEVDKLCHFVEAIKMRVGFV